MSLLQVDSPLRRNPVFWIMWLLPCAAVIGGLSTLAIALGHADRALPEAYHWEGERLERDFAMARKAALHGLQVTLEFQANGRCSALLRNAPDDPASLVVLLANGADAGLDRVILLQRTARGTYAAGCGPLPAGSWRVSVEDGAAGWAIRAQARGVIDRLELRARDPGGAS